MTAPAFRCDRCAIEVPADRARYQALLEIQHVADPLVVTEEELRRDHATEIRDLLAAMAKRDARELEEEVHVRRVARLCARCRRTLLAAFDSRPRGRRRRRRPGARPR